MNFQDFSQLTFEQKSDAVWEWGFFVGRRQIPGYNIVLYSVNGFFVEMTMRISDNSVQDIQPYESVNSQLEALFELSKDNPFVRSQRLTY